VRQIGASLHRSSAVAEDFVSDIGSDSRIPPLFKEKSLEQFVSIHLF